MVILGFSKAIGGANSDLPAAYHVAFSPIDRH